MGEEMEFASSVLRQGDSGVTLRLAHPGLVPACSCSHPSGVQHSGGTQPLLPWSRSLWVEPSTAGGKG